MVRLSRFASAPLLSASFFPSSSASSAFLQHRQSVPFCVTSASRRLSIFFVAFPSAKPHFVRCKLVSKYGQQIFHLVLVEYLAHVLLRNMATSMAACKSDAHAASSFALRTTALAAPSQLFSFTRRCLFSFVFLIAARLAASHVECLSGFDVALIGLKAEAHHQASRACTPGRNSRPVDQSDGTGRII